MQQIHLWIQYIALQGGSLLVSQLLLSLPASAQVLFILVLCMVAVSIGGWVAMTKLVTMIRVWLRYPPAPGSQLTPASAKLSELGSAYIGNASLQSTV